jgi:hypothetical protein
MGRRLRDYFIPAVWSEHFELDYESGRIIPHSAEGRVTIFLLRLNDTDRVMDRLLLITTQRYPCGDVT